MLLAHKIVIISKIKNNENMMFYSFKFMPCLLHISINDIMTNFSKAKNSRKVGLCSSRILILHS